MKAHYDHNGINAERLMVKWLTHIGYAVKPSSWVEDTRYDIDIWVRGYQFTDWASVSIKAMTAGIAYGQLGFELSTHRTRDGLGWFYTGQADHYLIIRDTDFLPSWRKDLRARMPIDHQPRYCWLPKQRVQNHTASYGWHHKSGLSPEMLKQQRGKDTVQGYLEAKKVLRPCDITLLPEDWKAIIGGREEVNHVH